MNRSGTDLRIRGLVSLMNHVRDQLRVGVQGNEARELRALVREGLRAVERLCREHGTTPGHLPAPSRRAYEYLSGLDLSRLPKPRRAAPPVREIVRIPGIVSTCNRYHHKFRKLVASGSTPHSSDDHEIQRLAGDLRTESDAIAALCEDAGTTPAALPVRSRYGFLWLKFLGNPQYLARHMNTLATLTREATRLMAAAVEYDQDPRPTLQCDLFATSVLYRTTVRGHSLQLLANEGFIVAPEPVLESLACAGLGLDDAERARMRVKQFAASEPFAELQAMLYRALSSPTQAARGQAHDLHAAFVRVNTAYFSGRVARPSLAWGRTRTLRKLGHYDQVRDTVVVSPVLDDRAVPEYVIDFVIYHELLHKELGVALVNGRRNAHTPAFRAAERAFTHYHEARTFIARFTHP